MKLSVIIPVHNAEDYIGLCLDSVLKQNFSDFEVICVDDASTDASAEVIEAYLGKDSRVSLIKNKENVYAGACRNRGIEAAKGEYIHFLDSDDLVEEGAYAAFYELAKAYDADVVKGSGRCFDNESGELCETPPLIGLFEVSGENLEKPFSFGEKAELLSHVSVVPWNGIYRRSLLMEKNIRFNHLVCVNDRSFFNEVTVAAKKIVLTGAPIVRYRVNNGQSLMGRRARNFRCHFESYEIVKSQCEKYGVKGENLRIVLDRELADIFLWYRRYRKIPELRKSMEADVREFAQGLDISIFGEDVKNLRWYRSYVQVMGLEPFYYKAGRRAKQILNKIIKGR